MRRHGRGQSGMTMVEIAVGLAVGALMVAGILLLVEQAQKAYMHSSEVTDLQQNVRVSIDRIVRIIQAAGVNPLNRQWGGATANDVAFTAFRETGRNCLRVYADLNGDGFVRDTDENVYFHWPTTPVDRGAAPRDAGDRGGAARRGPAVGHHLAPAPTSSPATSWPTRVARTCSGTSRASTTRWERPIRSWFRRPCPRRHARA